MSLGCWQGRIMNMRSCEPVARVRLEPVAAWSRRRGERQRHAEAGAATRAILDSNRTAVALDRMPRNREAQSGAAALAVARRIKAQERLEDSLTVGCGDARAAVVHHDLDRALCPR
jgi:hypothetical protein